ncbi:unnamed protein product [Acanthoscelides obtectus]|uniref:Uncharacterized protein n=1 Tax=Acanthoscelides obtectus TaxID=200917 RepID=A0A9P0PF24_ACAOB|nr:unnamed protein product [Acanthoscelides obtectus]CAK1643199.1 hypothetical protein AOBTE_LOCUS13444 [Acanthoscelides obtectus]
MCNHWNLYENCLFCTSRACLQVERFSVDSALWRGLIQNKIFKVLVQQGHILRGLVTETLAEVKQKKFLYFNFTELSLIFK